ncbi:tabersonine 16-hydroxylase 2-like [Humulus lupulus]|uniref:tabersonine 16-hydroxylase 2-like n=1 Tax=Humulus lupulus TaxID=3486 RepID=UPI002B416664|nr:tabersonine 16-hydroxylase 2-like [Humulus lupulus]
MFVAGGETSSTVVEWATAEMVKNPTVMKKAQEEVRQVFGGKENVEEENLNQLEFLDMIIKETLRLHPPVVLVPRESRESCVIYGYQMAEKTKLVVNTWAMGRDPKYWTDPEKFYPERFHESCTDFKGNDFEFIPFGAGRRMCPGIFFALADIKLPLAQLLFHFDWKLADGINLVIIQSL